MPLLSVLEALLALVDHTDRELSDPTNGQYCGGRYGVSVDALALVHAPFLREITSEVVARWQQEVQAALGA